MHPQEMEEVLAEIYARRLEKIRAKTKQYGTATDAFSRIMALAKKKGKSPEEITLDLSNKHIEGQMDYALSMSKGGDWRAYDERLSVSIPPLKIGDTYTRKAGDGLIEMYEDPSIYRDYDLCFLHLRMKGKLI